MNEDVSMGDMVVITRNCPICNNQQHIKVYKEDYIQWKKGKLIQITFPYLDDDQREWILSGVCGSCFDIMFSDEDFNNMLSDEEYQDDDEPAF